MSDSTTAITNLAHGTDSRSTRNARDSRDGQSSWPAPAVMGGQVNSVLNLGISLPYVQAGKVKLLGVLSSQRSSFFSQVPTLAEQVIGATELDIWFGIWAPRGTPPASTAD